jgi:hypothetical protein
MKERRCGKVRIKFEKEAWLVAWKLYKKSGRETSVYLCAIDGYYHLTSKKKRLPEWLIEIINNGIIPVDET